MLRLCWLLITFAIMGRAKHSARRNMVVTEISIIIGRSFSADIINNVAIVAAVIVVIMSSVKVMCSGLYRNIHAAMGRIIVANAINSVFVRMDILSILVYWLFLNSVIHLFTIVPMR